MKKILLASFLLLGVSATIFSCNNGAYDAQPNTDNSAALNPINTTPGNPNVYLGSMEAYLNGKKTIFEPAFKYVDGDGNMRIVARIKNDTLLERTLRISFAGIPDTLGKYTAEPALAISYSKIDTLATKQSGNLTIDVFTTSDTKSRYSLDIQGVEGGHRRGKLEASLIKEFPQAAPNDSVVFSGAEFYFKNEAFPLRKGLFQ